MTRKVSLAVSTDPAIRRACRVLTMVHELHKAGYQKLRISSGMSPAGTHWRCHITPASNIGPDGWEVLNWMHDVVSYSTGDEDRFFGFEDGPGKSARQLADMFSSRFPEIMERAEGQDREYVGWYVDMLGAAEHGRLPIFFADYELDPVPGEMPPPPQLSEPQLQGLTVSLIENDNLRPEDVPLSTGRWEEIEPFCLTYDGYANGRRSVNECGEIANRVFAGDLRSISMDDLRIALFFQQRMIRWNSDMPVQPKHVDQIRPVIEEIRRRVAGRAVGHNSDRPWLNSFDIIDGIVRRFTSDVLNQYALIAPEWPIDKFIAWAQAECDRYNHLFLTYELSPDTDYTRGVWNTPQNLGCFILIANGMSGDASKGVRDVFMNHVVAVTGTFVDHHKEQVEEWGWKLDALMEDLIANLLGFQEYDFDLLKGYVKAANDITSDQKADSS